MPTSHCCILRGIACRFIMVTNVVIKIGWAPMKMVGEIAL